MYVDAILDHYLPYRYVYPRVYIIIIIVPNNKTIDLVVSLLTAAYSINCRLFFYECTVVCTNLQITVHS